MANNKVPVVKKKVRPYPFKAELELNALKKPVEVLHINQKGAIVRLSTALVFVGEFYQMVFEFPVIKVEVNAQVRVIKTNDKVVNADKAVERTAELHFQKLSPEQAGRIHSFLTAIRQEEA